MSLDCKMSPIKDCERPYETPKEIEDRMKTYSPSQDAKCMGHSTADAPHIGVHKDQSSNLKEGLEVMCKDIEREMECLSHEMSLLSMRSKVLDQMRVNLKNLLDGTAGRY